MGARRASRVPESDASSGRSFQSSSEPPKTSCHAPSQCAGLEACHPAPPQSRESRSAFSAEAAWRARSPAVEKRGSWLVDTGGFEPPTPAMSRRCSRPLSYVSMIQLKRRIDYPFYRGASTASSGGPGSNPGGIRIEASRHANPARVSAPPGRDGRAVLAFPLIGSRKPAREDPQSAVDRVQGDRLEHQPRIAEVRQERRQSLHAEGTLHRQ